MKRVGKIILLAILLFIISILIILLLNRNENGLLLSKVQTEKLASDEYRDFCDLYLA